MTQRKKLEFVSEALHNARILLVALGGDQSSLIEQSAKAAGCDMVQWATLRQIDAAQETIRELLELL